ncbi:hypothetical protein FISHEDRAFT_42641 [Fistulina hepatica ATCC 64428]|uniref:Uncharacterized protein n=1 Tax=Fistulina hepatica ATCC 64428 TaxID=1128425 RepID=A0A0D7AEH4_9AGAR|nr:hypothetical protein FISHEDRAFT_42641 [Fistulina hepatica ATCC 64428]
MQIFNATRYSACPPDSRAPPGAIHEDIAEAHFSQKVSPVLPAHALLHHFIREHDVSRAHDLATSMMKEGIRLHGRSLRALVRVATQPGPTPFTLLYKSYKSARSGFKPLDLSNARSRDPNTNFALSLMRTAREAQYKHTDEILAQIIKLCTFNGELCLAGMIFAAVIIDWQRRKALAAQLQSGIEHMQDDQPPQPPSQQERPNSLRRGAYLSPNMPWIQLVTSIEHVLSTERETEQWDDVQAEALQTLTILAELLDNQEFPYRNVAPLLRALYRCPKTKRKVWIRNNDGSYRKVVAYQYFHEILLRFIGDLPTKRPPIPDLDLASYNTLLHYTLRHWLSTDLASSVLTHMTQVRNPPLNPDRVTLNILLSCGTKLRRNDVVQQGFDVLGDTQENAVEHIVDGAIAKVRYLKQHALEGVTSMAPPTGDLSPRSTRSVAPVVDADMRTIVALMTYLTSSGNPHGAVHVLLRFLPELSSTDPPSWDSLPPEEKTRRRGIARQECVQRAKLLGPHFFVAALNALVKSGRSGLAERVWFLAKSAETASGHAWILPTEAYTIMVQCYGAEARKFAMACFQKPVPRLASTGMARASLDRSSEEWYQWVPRTQRHVVGWASFLDTAAGSRQEPLLRSEAGYRIAALFYEFIARKVRDVGDALVLQDDLPQHVHPPLPRPDAKFFNAALKVFSHRLLTRASQAMVRLFLLILLFF